MADTVKGLLEAARWDVYVRDMEHVYGWDAPKAPPLCSPRAFYRLRVLWSFLVLLCREVTNNAGLE
jgi:hypothetical protein